LIDAAMSVPTIDRTIGNTPLVRLQRIPGADNARRGNSILGKLEGNNPGGSVKDRPAYSMIARAEERGEIKPGDRLIEATSGNTGIALAMIAAMKGYRMTLIMPDDLSAERRTSMTAYGAELILTPAARGGMEYARDVALQMQTDGAGRVLDQFANPDNPRAHYETTGPEIWRDTGGKLDGFICSVGTGGTLAGVSSYLKEKNKVIVIGCADPSGAAMYELFKHGEAKSTPGDSITEGIGLGRVTPVIKQARVDDAYLIPDEEAVPIIYELLEHEGLCLGGSTGINVAGAIRLAKQLGPGKTIVTILADSGNRYQSKLFNPDFMRSKNLPVPGWLEKRTKIDVPFEKA